MANAAAPLELECLFHVTALLEMICLFSLSKATFLKLYHGHPIFRLAELTNR